MDGEAILGALQARFGGALAETHAHRGDHTALVERGALLDVLRHCRDDGALGFDMLADLTAMQLYCLQIGRLAEAGRLTPTVAGLAKMHNTRKARAITADARDMLGGNGILLDYQVMRHMVDMEAIHTFEGTETMQTLIVGRAITGIGAFT